MTKFKLKIVSFLCGPEWIYGRLCNNADAHILCMGYLWCNFYVLTTLNAKKETWIYFNEDGLINLFMCPQRLVVLYLKRLYKKVINTLAYLTFIAGTKEATSSTTISRGRERTSLRQETERSPLYCCILISTWVNKYRNKERNNRFPNAWGASTGKQLWYR